MVLEIEWMLMMIMAYGNFIQSRCFNDGIDAFFSTPDRYCGVTIEIILKVADVNDLSLVFLMQT